MTNVTIIIPCYNEEEMLPIFIKKMDELFNDDDNYKYDFIFVNDGSKDNTLDIIKQLANSKDNVSYVSLSRNFGQDAAIASGYKIATGDAVIVMDCDLQDPPELIPQMLEKFNQGYEIVNPKRVRRDEDTYLKKTTSGLFYKFINKISGREVIPDNVSMFRLVSKRGVEIINSLPESSRVMRSEIPYIGLKTCTIPFERHARKAGKTKYNFSKLFELACKTITSSTNTLLNYVLKIGMGLMFVGIIGLITTFICHISYFCIDNLSALNLASFFILGYILSAVFLITGLISIVLYIPTIYIKEIQTNTQNRPNNIPETIYIAKSVNGRRNSNE